MGGSLFHTEGGGKEHLTYVGEKGKAQTSPWPHFWRIDLNCLSITKAKTKENPQIFMCNRFRADGIWHWTMFKHQRFPEWSWRSFRRNWWRTSGEVWKEIFELLLLGKLSEAFSTKTPPQISPSNFTTRFWVVAALNVMPRKKKEEAVEGVFLSPVTSGLCSWRPGKRECRRR